MGKLNTAILVDRETKTLKVFDQYEEEREDIVESEVAEAEDAVADETGNDSEAAADAFLESVVDNSETQTALPDELCPVPYAPWDEAAEHAKDDAKFIATLKEIGDEIDECKEEIAELTERLKEAKASLKLAEKKLLRTSKEGPQYRKKPEPPKPVAESRKPEADAVPASVASENPGSDAKSSGSTEPLPDPVNEEWRAIKTETLIQGIERFGKKKQEALIDLCPTLGDLVELQKKASLQHMQFHELLPKGIGQGIADELEERIAAKSWKKVE